MHLKPETLAEIERVLPLYPVRRSAVLPVLHAIQKDQGCVTNEAVAWVAAKLGLAPINVYELISFYPFFRQTPTGRHRVRVCRTLSCALVGGKRLGQVLEEEFGCRLGQTSPDGLVTLEEVECLASCGTGPVLLVDDQLHEKMDEAKTRALAARLKAGARAPVAGA